MKSKSAMYEKYHTHFRAFGILISVIFFFSLPVLFTADSSLYLEYLNHFEGSVPWTEWNNTRGWGFPLFLWIERIIFGESAYGMSIWLYLLYLLFAYVTYNLCKTVFRNKAFSNFAVIVFVLVNPIVVGFFHFILTEPLAATIVALLMWWTLYNQLKHKKDNEEQNYKETIIRYIVAAAASIYLYFVKETFFLIPILIIALSDFYLCLFRKKSAIKAILGLCVVGIVLLGSAKMWNNFVDTPANAERHFGEGTFKRYIVKGLNYFSYNESDEVIIVYNDENEEIDRIDFAENDSSIKYVLTCVTKHPVVALKGYFENYLALSNLYGLEKPSSDGKVIKQVSITRGMENLLLAEYPRFFKLKIHTYEELGYKEYTTAYGQYTDSNVVVDLLYSNNCKTIYNALFTLSLVYAPFAFILHFLILAVKFFRKKQGTEHNGIQFVLSGTVFLYGMALAMVCMKIDRYMFPVFLLAMIMLTNDFMLLTRIITRKIKEKI